MNTYVNTIVGEIPRDLLEQSQVVLALDNIAEIDADMLAMLPIRNLPTRAHGTKRGGGRTARRVDPRAASFVDRGRGALEAAPRGP